MKKALFFLTLLSSSQFSFTYGSNNLAFSLSEGVSKTLRNEPFLVALAGYTLLFRPEWIHEHQFISGFFGTCLLGAFIKNCMRKNYFEHSNNSLLKTAYNCPFSVGLALYVLLFDRQIIHDYPLPSTIFAIWLGAQWAENL